MMDKTLRRRIVTISLVFAAACVVSLLLPLLLVVALAVDLWRRVTQSMPAMAVRIVAYAWVYLLGEVFAVIVLGVVAALGRERSRAMTYLLQEVWASWNFAAFRQIFDVRFEVEGGDAVVPPPLIVLARHASLIDSLLPVVLIAARGGPNLRYVLKKELLVDPALDIAGNRLPNYFLDRKSSDFDAELESIRELARGTHENAGIVIFPEGTRFSAEKLALLIARAKTRVGSIAEMTQRFRRVLPPRPAGTLAILDSSDADVVVLAHHGLEGLAKVVDFWKGGLVGSTVSVSLRRIPRALVPEDRNARVEWLFRTWLEVDDWVSGKEMMNA